MNNLGLFFQFGIRMQGGPAFLKRTRTPFGQLQTRLRSGTSAQQCFYSSSIFTIESSNRTTNCTVSDGGSFTFGNCNNASVARCCIVNTPGVNWACFNFPRQFQTVCNWGAFSAWTNTSSCTPTSTCGSNGNRQCQTIYSFREQDWSAYEEVDVCVVASPIAALNAVQVECVPQ
jgi:hypothetical protein